MWVRWRSFLSFFLLRSLLFTFSTWYYILWTNDNVSTSTQLSAAVLFTSPFSHVHNLDIWGDIFLCWMPPPTHLLRANNSIYFVNSKWCIAERKVAKLSTYETFRPHTSIHTHFFPGVKYNFNFDNIFLVSSNFHPAGRQTLFFFVFIYVILSTIYISQFADLNILIRLSAELDFMRSLACG